MLDNDEVLESMQADILGILQHTPSLKGHVFMDNEGDFNSRLEKSLGTKTAGSTGKRGLAIIVLQVDVIEAEKNLPGPPLKMRVRVLVIENIVINRSATKGTLQRSSQAALNILNTLQLAGLGAHTLYADKSPVSPQTVPEGLSSHMVTLYVQAGMNPIIKPLEVQASLTVGGGDGILVAGTLTSNGSTPLVFPGEIPAAGTANGRPTYFLASGDEEFGAIWKTIANPFTGSGDFTGWFLQEDVNGVSWASTADVATPDLVPAGAWHVTTNPLAWRTVSPATGTPVVTASGASTVTLTCDSPGSTIRFTADGSYPSPDKTLYTGPFALPAAGTLVRAAAYVADQPPGDVLEFTVTE